ncbi:MarR family winged helix-turn-helix transcriptional regulator [Saccharibacillus alkalitolerans]|uniref:MarR family transcriptional regulator n=1 Tax=Saccharibacillus alkalitolerans TaxID=2705290 RepID=A0ABX0F6D6_9BACL|nr:MarR family transcriptional regulator [Saccharibacillus alkalitolerans]NGZ75564.1 MarR family transcriptional regulator [Saccharibacillus alkalitolerans]
MEESTRASGEPITGNAKQLIDRFLGSWLSIEREFGALVRSQMQEDMTSDQYYLLQTIIQRGPCTSSELADAFKVVKSSITAIVTRLVDRGLIERTRNEQDRREVYLTLTERGREMAVQAEQRITESFAKYLKHFSEDEVETVLAAFDRLAMLVKEDGGREKK